MAAQVEWASGEVPLVVHYAGCTFCRCTARCHPTPQQHCVSRAGDRRRLAADMTLSPHLHAEPPASPQVLLLHAPAGYTPCCNRVDGMDLLYS